jgi:hypothetical protein
MESNFDARAVPKRGLMEPMPHPRQRATRWSMRAQRRSAGHILLNPILPSFGLRATRAISHFFRYVPPTFAWSLATRGSRWPRRQTDTMD